MKKILILFVGILVFFSGCLDKQSGINTQNSEVANLKNTSWTLKKIDGNLFRPFIVSGKAMGFSTLSFDEKTIAGSSGVNKFRGTYELKGDTLVSSPIISTKMAALNVILAENEKKIFEVLNAEDKKVAADSENLTISSSKGTLFYQKDNPLKNSSWRLKSLSALDLSIFEKEKLPTLDFSQKTLYGFSGVNRFHASYSLNAESVKVGTVATTLMAGISEEVNKLEREFLKSLDGTQAFKIDENTNTLTFGEMVLESVSFQAGTLNNNVWNLAMIDDENIAEFVKKEGIKELSVQFKDDRIFGFSGVNRFTGQYALHNRNIYISPLATTKMLGINESVNKLEQRFVEILSNVEYLELKDHETMFFYSKDHKLTFKRVYM